MEGENHRRQSSHIFAIFPRQDGVCDGQGRHERAHRGSGHGQGMAITSLWPAVVSIH